jgi:hypothetical protein
VSFCLDGYCTFKIKKSSIGSVFKNFFSIYFGGYINEKTSNKRKWSWFCFVFIGLLPYVVGVLGTLSFLDALKNVDFSILASFAGMLLSIMAILLGFEILNEKVEKKRIRDALNETNSLLFVGIILIVFDSFFLALVSACLGDLANTVLLCLYFAIKLKIIILLIISLHNIYFLNKDDQKSNSDNNK